MSDFLYNVSRGEVGSELGVGPQAANGISGDLENKNEKSARNRNKDFTSGISDSNF